MILLALAWLLVVTWGLGATLAGRLPEPEEFLHRNLVRIALGHLGPRYRRPRSAVAAPRRPPLPDSCFMSFCISLNCLTSRLTSVNDVPEPAAT